MRTSLLLPLAAHAAWLGPPAARSPPAPHAAAAAARAPAPVLLDYIKESHDWETSQTPFDYSQDADWLAEGVEVVRSQNPTMLPLLTRLRDFEFFRYFAVDLLAGCSYIPTEDEPCGLDACEIDPVDDEVPEGMRARDEDEYEFDLDAWARWDMPSDFTEYYDVTALGEGNTQYDGSRVWKFIHQKICFQKRLNDDESAWKRDFNRAISGMHSSVSAHIIADIERSGDIDEARRQYERRLRDEPGAIDNLHFAYMIVLCALREMRPRLDACNYLGEGGDVQPIIRQVTSAPLLRDAAVQRAAQALREHAQGETVFAWKMRLRTRDLLRIMNCVQCNLCRLHGKVAALGVSSALQVLLGTRGRGDGCDAEADPYSLHRVQVAALVTTAAKFGKACETVERFRQLEGGVPPSVPLNTCEDDFGAAKLKA